MDNVKDFAVAEQFGITPTTPGASLRTQLGATASAAISSEVRFVIDASFRSSVARALVRGAIAVVPVLTGATDSGLNLT